MQQRWSWEEMLQAFLALGGIAENVRLDSREGGLFANKPDQPVLLRVPENLLIELAKLEFAEQSLRLRDNEDASPTVRAFLDRYEHSFGHAIHAQAAADVAALDSLSGPVKDLLSRNFGMRRFFEGDSASRIERRFVDSRGIQRGEARVLAPVLELAKHGPQGLTIQQNDSGISIGGRVRGRVDIFHPSLDALAIFNRYGLAAAQPAAYSLPMRFVSDGFEIAIGRKMHLSDRRGNNTVPRLDVIGRGNLEISHLMIGHSRFPRLARGIFRTRMRDAGLDDADENFDRIAQENSARLLQLLDVLGQEDGAAAVSLKRTALRQLEAMSWAIGAREI